jgi:hypothetical protein
VAAKAGAAWFSAYAAFTLAAGDPDHDRIRVSIGLGDIQRAVRTGRNATESGRTSGQARARLHAMKRPDAIEAAQKFVNQIVAGSPEQMTARLHAEIEGVKELAATAGIKAEN